MLLSLFPVDSVRSARPWYLQCCAHVLYAGCFFLILLRLSLMVAVAVPIAVADAVALAVDATFV